MTTESAHPIVAVALNPAIDRVLEVPGLTLGSHQVARLLTRYPGGKAVNLAKGLALLDTPCTLTGLVGAGEFEEYEREAGAFGIRMEMLPVAGHTRENITLVDPAARQETHLRDRGFAVQPAELEGLREKLGQLARPGAIFVFSGSLPQGIGPAVFAELLAQCRRAGSLLAVDASGPALPAAVAGAPWLIKPNREELEELLGRGLGSTAELMSAGGELAGRIELVLVSCGSEGAYLFASGAAWHGRCAIAAEQVVSTVGCGDALLAGFLAGRHKGLDHPASLKLAVAAAAATAMSLTTLFDAGRVEALLAKAEVRELRTR